MPVPESNNLGPCIRITTLEEDGWNLLVHGVILAVPPKVIKSQHGNILKGCKSHVLNGATVNIGDKVTIKLQRDATVAQPNPLIKEISERIERRTFCHKGGVLVQFRCKDMKPEWEPSFHQIVSEQLALKQLHLTEKVTSGNLVQGIVHTLPGHPLHEDPQVTLEALPAFTIKTSIQEQEQENIQKTLKAFCKKGHIEIVDGEWRVVLNLKGTLLPKQTEMLKALQTELESQLLQLEADDPKHPISTNPNDDGLFLGFISRHPNSFDVIKTMWEGKEMKISM